MSGWLLPAAAGGMWVGIVLEGFRAPPHSIALPVALLASGAGALVVARRRRPAEARPVGRTAVTIAALGPLVASFGLLGAGWAGVRDARLAASPIAASAGRSAEIEGVLTSDPAAGSTDWHAVMQAASLDAGAPAGAAHTIVEVHDAVWLEGHGYPPPLRTGDRVRVSCLLGRAAGGFGEYLRRTGVAGTCSAGDLERLPTHPSLPSRAADAVRSTLRRSVESVFADREGGLVLGLALGDTSRLSDATQDEFRATGLSHLTAVSGENLAMFLAPILGLVTWMGLGRRARFAIGLGAIAFFVVLAKAQPSVLRAAAMAGLAMLGLFLGRPRTIPAVMGAAVLALLVASPLMVYSIGFQLSVAATAGMAAISDPLARRLTFVPSGLGLAAATTIGAQAGVTPLLLYHFGVVPTVSVPANLLAFPAVGLGMLLGLAAAAIGLVSHAGGLFVAWVARAPLDYLLGVANHLARSPLPAITSPGGQGVALVAGLGAVALAAAWLHDGIRVPTRAAVAAAMVVPLFMWSGAARAGRPSALTMTFFYVGWGDSELLRSPGGATILIDGGPDPQLVANKLAALGVRRIDVMVATHPHADHVVGLPAVLTRFPVGLVLDAGCRAPSPFYRDFLDAVDRAGARVWHPRAGASLRVGDVHLDVLAPEHCFHATHSDPNNDSIVLRATVGSSTVLLAGDAERESQTEILRDRSALLAAPLMKWPHHGGNTNLDQFYDAAVARGTRVAIISTGPNLYHDPLPLVLQALARHGIRVYRTDVAGDITIRIEGRRLLIQSSHA